MGRRGKSPGTGPSTSTAKGILDDTIQAALRNMNPSDKIKTLAIVMDMDMFDKSGMILQNRFDIMNAMEDHISVASPEERDAYSDKINDFQN